jgi:adenosylmethionine-8-amino-7-oxononanoate aminotransferase
MSVVAVRPEVAGRLRSATSMRRLPGSTQAGDPVGCASVQAVLEYCRDAQNSAARERSAGILRTGIEQLADEPVVESIFGIGHLWGIRIRDEFVVSAPSFIRKFTALGLNHGLLLHPLSAGVVPVMPALTISDGEIADLATRLRSVLRAAADGASGGS